MDPHELCSESFLHLPCQRCRVVSVPGSLSVLDEAFPCALDHSWKVVGQGCEAPAQLNLSSLPGGHSRLSGLRSSDVFGRRVGVASLRVLFNLAEGSVLGRIVLSQAGSVFEEICLQGFILALLVPPHPRSLHAPLSWTARHAGALSVPCPLVKDRVLARG